MRPLVVAVISARGARAGVCGSIRSVRCCWNLAFVSVLLAGCYPVSELQTARVVEAGRVRVGVGTRWQTVGPHGRAEQPTWFIADLGLRLGLGKGVDVGLRLTGAYLGADTKLQLYDAPDLTVALAPALALTADSDVPSGQLWSGARSEGLAVLRVPLFVSTRASDHVELWIAPSLHTGIYVENAPGPMLAFACVFGVDIRLSPGFTLQPQVGTLFSVAGPGPVEGLDRRLSRGDQRVTAAINIFLGR